MAETDSDARVRSAAQLPASDDLLGNEALHLYWLDVGDAVGKVVHQRYVLVDASGLVKAGTTDLRGESSELQLTSGEPFFDLLDDSGQLVGTRTAP